VNTNGAGHGKPDVQMLREEIQQTRHDLGETVQALAAKADVKARARESVEHAKARVRDSVGHATERVRGTVTHAAHQAADVSHDAGVKARRNPVPVGVVLAAGAALIITLLILRGRRR
jgi:ElaB/YqjD/DUF883 family membrane-anchored ribosome-binding protein